MTGLDGAAVRRLNQLLSNAACQHVRPPVHPLTENVQTAHGLVMVVNSSAQAWSMPMGLFAP